jgi:hypothetical protein
LNESRLRFCVLCVAQHASGAHSTVYEARCPHPVACANAYHKTHPACRHTGVSHTHRLCASRPPYVCRGARACPGVLHPVESFPAFLSFVTSPVHLRTISRAGQLQVSCCLVVAVCAQLQAAASTGRRRRPCWALLGTQCFLHGL